MSSSIAAPHMASDSAPDFLSAPAADAASDLPAALSAASWMQQSWPGIARRSLNQIALPGSHAAGMSVLSGSSTFANPCNSQTQSLSIAQQIAHGVRYFDLRPVWGGKLHMSGFSSGAAQFYLGHFADLPVLGMQGSTGEKLGDVLHGIAQFFRHGAHAQELLILKFSHYLNYLDGQGFDAHLKKKLRELLLDKLGAHMIRRPVAGPGADLDLNQASLQQLLAAGNVLCLFDDFLGFYDPAYGIFACGAQTACDVPLAQRSAYAPALASGKSGMLYAMLVQEHSHQLLLYQLHGRAMHCAAPHALAYASACTPGLALGPDGMLYCIFVQPGSHLLRFCSSHDGGQNWSGSGPLEYASAHAPALLLAADGSLLTVFLAHGGNTMLLCRSGDGGQSWSAASPVWQNVRQAPALALAPDGSLYLLCCTVDEGILLLCSRDTGHSWTQCGALPQDAAQESVGAPSLCLTPDGRLHVSFSGNFSQGVQLLYCCCADGGKCWSQPVPLSSLPSLAGSAAASGHGAALSAASDGSLFAVFTALDNQLLSSRSNLGLVWPPAHALAPGRRPALAVGAHGTLYALFVEAQGQGLRFCASSDRGGNWSGSIATGHVCEQTPALAVGKDGILYALLAQNAQAFLCTSKDGGHHWSNLLPLMQASCATAALSVDTHGTLHALLAQPDGAMLCRSHDGGKSWDCAAAAPPDGQRASGAVTLAADGRLLSGPPADTAWHTALPACDVAAAEAALAQARDGSQYLLCAHDGMLFCSAAVRAQVWREQREDGHFFLSEASSESCDVAYVMQDQKRKFAAFETGAQGGAFLLDWTGSCANGVKPCVADMADQLNLQLLPQLQQWRREGMLQRGKVPNILFMDYCNNSKYRLLDAVAFLNQLHQTEGGDEAARADGANADIDADSDADADLGAAGQT